MSRDESMAEYMLKMLVQVLINFSMGLIMALVVSSKKMHIESILCRRITHVGKCILHGMVFFDEPWAIDATTNATIHAMLGRYSYSDCGQ